MMSSHKLWEQARRYYASGFSLIPCHRNKRPVSKWDYYTIKRPTLSEINSWFTERHYQSIGLVGGSVSHNVIFIDLDGIGAIKKFANRFPEICESTKSVLTGSQEGIHLYVRVVEIPDNINVRVEGVGGFEIRGNGQYVIAPPSPHPSGNKYRVYRNKPILHLNHLYEVREWMANLRTNEQHKQAEIIQQSARPQNISFDASKQAYLNKVVSEELARVETATQGNRNNALFYASLRLANYSAGGELNWSDMAQKLFVAGCSTGSHRQEVQKTIESAYRIGSKRPKKVS